MNNRNSIVFAVAAAGLILSPGVFAQSFEAGVGASVSKAAQADPALAGPAGLAVPAHIPTSEGVPAPAPAAPSEETAPISAETPTLSADLGMTKLEKNGYHLVPAQERPAENTSAGPSFGERLSRLCQDNHDHISFDCVESPAIALMNIAEENHRKSPATYWIVGALGMILGAILFVPALAIALVTGGVKVIHDIATGP